LPYEILRGAVPLKVVLALTPPHKSTSSAKVLSGYTSNTEVIVAYLFHFKPIFDNPLKKVVRRAAVPGGMYVSKTWSFSSACKNLEAQHRLEAKIFFSKKCVLGRYDFTSKSPRSLDRNLPDLFCLTQEESR